MDTLINLFFAVLATLIPGVNADKPQFTIPAPPPAITAPLGRTQTHAASEVADKDECTEDTRSSIKADLAGARNAGEDYDLFIGPLRYKMEICSLNAEDIGTSEKEFTVLFSEWQQSAAISGKEPVRISHNKHE